MLFIKDTLDKVILGRWRFLNLQTLISQNTYQLAIDENGNLGTVISNSGEVTGLEGRVEDLESKLEGITSSVESAVQPSDLSNYATIEALNTGLDSKVNLAQLQNELDNKVDVLEGMQLSQESFTTEEKTKLAGLESPKFKGQFLSLSDLNTADVGEVGGYAYVDGGLGGTVDLYIWDAVNSLWEVVAGEPTAETPASIKSKYESNPDTNVLTDIEKQVLNNLLSDDRFSLKRLGTWNASTNTPELLQGEGTRGDYYVVTTSGSYDFGNGIIKFNQGDWVIFTGGIWHKLVTTDSIVNWNDVQNKPNLPSPPRGNISAAIPSLTII